jgi:hypothetical protein
VSRRSRRLQATFLLRFQHLMFIKELTDQGRLQYDHPLALCLVPAVRGTTIPLKETPRSP